MHSFATRVVGLRTLLAGAPLNMTEFPKHSLRKNLVLSKDLQLVHQNHPTVSFPVFLVVVLLFLPVGVLIDVLMKTISLF